MVTEVQKYRAQFFQILGLACLTPIGRIFLSIPNISLKDFNVKFLIYCIASVLLIYLGIILIVRGIEVLEGYK